MDVWIFQVYALRDTKSWCPFAWRLHTKFSKFGWDTFLNNAQMRHQSSITSQILDLIYWMVAIFIVDNVTAQTSRMENGKRKKAMKKEGVWFIKERYTTERRETLVTHNILFFISSFQLKSNGLKYLTFGSSRKISRVTKARAWQPKTGCIQLTNKRLEPTLLPLNTILHVFFLLFEFARHGSGLISCIHPLNGRFSSLLLFLNLSQRFCGINVTFWRVLQSVWSPFFRAKFKKLLEDLWNCI